MLLPLRTPGLTPVKVLTFIHGFEITSVESGSVKSSFEVKVINVAHQSHGIAMLITLNSNSKVFNVFLSIIAYDQTLTSAFGGNYEYNSYVPVKTL